VPSTSSGIVNITRADLRPPVSGMTSQHLDRNIPNELAAEPIITLFRHEVEQGSPRPKI
jgi:hypothetical protein